MARFIDDHSIPKGLGLPQLTVSDFRFPSESEAPDVEPAQTPGLENQAGAAFRAHLRELGVNLGDTPRVITPGGLGRLVGLQTDPDMKWFASVRLDGNPHTHSYMTSEVQMLISMAYQYRGLLSGPVYVGNVYNEIDTEILKKADLVTQTTSGYLNVTEKGIAEAIAMGWLRSYDTLVN